MFQFFMCLPSPKQYCLVFLMKKLKKTTTKEPHIYKTENEMKQKICQKRGRNKIILTIIASSEHTSTNKCLSRVKRA